MNQITIEGVGVIKIVPALEILSWSPCNHHDCDYIVSENYHIPSAFVIGIRMTSFDAIFLLPTLAVDTMEITVINVKSRAICTYALFTNAEDAAMFKLML